MSTPAYQQSVPWIVRHAGLRHAGGRGSYRMRWGELTVGRSGFACELSLFDDRPRFSLHLAAFWVSVFIALPFLARFAREPEEMMESWGWSFRDGNLFLRWGSRVSIWTAPWADWQQIAHDVRRSDGCWVPYVGSWARGKQPDGRETESWPYRYLLQSGEVQERTATIYVERRVRRLRILRWASWFQRVTYAIDVDFSGEVGERSGSWKGGTVGCAYEMKPDETPRECLRRMERERRFR